MKRDKNLVYRILKTFRDTELDSFDSNNPETNLMNHREFSDLFGDGLIHLHYHYHMLGDMGCFLYYVPDFGVVRFRSLSWLGHDLLESLEREGYSLPDPDTL